MVVQNVHETATRGFSKQVDAYERGRPSYPAEAITAALAAFGLDRTNQPQNPKVLDLAAGTGKLTRLLAAHSHLDVQAVEPNNGMREGFARLQSSWGIPRPIPIHDGSATDLPFSDGTFDAVFVGQGFHWFSNEAALREIARVLKPKGGLALIWNREEETTAWQADLLHIFEPLSVGIPQYWQGTWRQAFDTDFAREALGVKDSKAHSQYFRWTNTTTREALWARLLSRSYIAALDADKQQEVKRALAALMKKHPKVFHTSHTSDQDASELDELNFEGDDKIEVLIRTEVFTCEKQQ